MNLLEATGACPHDVRSSSNEGWLRNTLRVPSAVLREVAVVEEVALGSAVLLASLALVGGQLVVLPRLRLVDAREELAATTDDARLLLLLQSFAQVRFAVLQQRLERVEVVVGTKLLFCQLNKRLHEALITKTAWNRVNKICLHKIFAFSACEFFTCQYIIRYQHKY